MKRRYDAFMVRPDSMVARLIDRFRKTAVVEVISADGSIFMVVRTGQYYMLGHDELRVPKGYTSAQVEKFVPRI